MIVCVAMALADRAVPLRFRPNDLVEYRTQLCLPLNNSGPIQGVEPLPNRPGQWCLLFRLILSFNGLSDGLHVWAQLHCIGREGTKRAELLYSECVTL